MQSCFYIFPANIASCTNARVCKLDWCLAFFFFKALLAILECSERQQVLLEEKVYNNLYFLYCGAKKTLNVGFIVFSTLKGI